MSLPFPLFGPGQYKLPLSVCTNKPLLASTFCSPCRHRAPWKPKTVVIPISPKWAGTSISFLYLRSSIRTNQQLVFIINSISTKGVYTKPPEIIEILLILTSFMFAKWNGAHKFNSLLQIRPYPLEIIGCCLPSQQKRATKEHLRPLGHSFLGQSHHSRHVRTTQWCTCWLLSAPCKHRQEFLRSFSASSSWRRQYLLVFGGLNDSRGSAQVHTVKSQHGLGFVLLSKPRCLSLND